MPPITYESYTLAITGLLKIAQQDSSGSRVAALLLLSAYNSYHWGVPVADMGLLDIVHYRYAMDLIRGRVELRTEPQQLIPDGDNEFKALWEQWIDYAKGQNSGEHLIDDALYEEW